MSGQREIRYSRLLSKFRRVLLLFEKACVQVFDVADIKLDDPANKTQTVYGILSEEVYGILSEDKQQVEVFASDLPENTILEAVKRRLCVQRRQSAFNENQEKLENS